MPLTKSATEFLQGCPLTKEAAPGSPLARYLYDLAGKTYNAGKAVGRGAKWFAEGPASKTYRYGVKPLLNAGLNTANAIGEVVVKHPKRALPALALAGAGAYHLKDRINRNILHVDPNTDVTTYRPRPWLGETVAGKVPIPFPNVFSDVQYNNPAAKDYFKKQNLVFG